MDNSNVNEASAFKAAGGADIMVERNTDTDKYEILQGGKPMVNDGGTRVDGGGHDFKDKADRQVGHIVAGIEKKAAREAKEAEGVVRE